MSPLHMHLVLNHVPVIGMIFVAFILGVALWRRNDGIAKLGLVMIAGIGVVTAAVFLTGEPAEEAVEKLAGVAGSAIHDHEELAEAALGAAAIAGAMAIVLLAWARKRVLPRAAMALSLLVVIAVAGLMGRTAYLGGQIRHTEIAGATVAAGEVEEDDR